MKPSTDTIPGRRRTSSTRWIHLFTPLAASVLLVGCGASDTSDSSAATPWDWSEDRVREAVNQVRAGRDLTPTEWPGGARVAALLSFDVDNETVQGLRTGSVSIGPLSQGEYGARVALPRIVRLLDAENVPATFFFPAWSLKLAPEQAGLIQGSGMHEIGMHGWIHELNTSLDGPTERRLLVQAMEAMEEITGERPVGYRAPSWNFSPNTLSIVRELGFDYESSLMADDRPYELVQDGEPTGVVEIPVEWILDDAPLFNPRGNSYMNPRDVMQVWIDEFDKAWEEGTMFVLTMHPHVSGHRSRIVALEGLIEHMQQKGDVWFATHAEAAAYVRAQAGLPSPTPPEAGTIAMSSSMPSLRSWWPDWMPISVGLFGVLFVLVNGGLGLYARKFADTPTVSSASTERLPGTSPARTPTAEPGRRSQY